MYDKDDLKIEGNEILVKKYTGDINTSGIKHYNWETLLEVNRNNCKQNLYSTMMNLLNIFTH